MQKNKEKRYTPEIFQIKPSTVKILGNHNRRTNIKSLSSLEFLNLNQKKKENLYIGSENTEKLCNESKSYNISPRTKNYKSKSFKPFKDIIKIKDSITEILDESIKTHAEIRKLREKLDSSQNYKENSQIIRDLPVFDASSIIKSPKKQKNSIQDQLFELKNQLHKMNSKLQEEEKQVNLKSIENYSLKFTIMTMQEQLEKIKQKKEENRLEKAKCSCLVF